ELADGRRQSEPMIPSERLSAVGHLVAGVAHEINNPLQAIMGTTELLMASGQAAGVRADLDQIRRDGIRAATIVQNLLAFAQRSAIDRSIADLNEIARSAVASPAAAPHAAGLPPENHIADDPPLIAAQRPNHA